MYTIYETNNDDKLLINNTVNNTIDNDITIDNETNTQNIEKKLIQTPPFLLDLNLTLQNELSHPHQRRKKNNKKGHKK